MLDILDHVGFPVTDYARSVAFYQKALAPLGIVILKQFSLSEDGADGYAGFGRQRPQFWIGTGASLTGRLHVAFAAANRQEVEAFMRLRWQQVGATTAPLASGRTITRTIMADLSWIRTVTISRR